MAKKNAYKNKTVAERHLKNIHHLKKQLKKLDDRIDVVMGRMEMIEDSQIDTLSLTEIQKVTMENRRFQQKYGIEDPEEVLREYQRQKQANEKLEETVEAFASEGDDEVFDAEKELLELQLQVTEEATTAHEQRLRQARRVPSVPSQPAMPPPSQPRGGSDGQVKQRLTMPSIPSAHADDDKESVVSYASTKRSVRRDVQMY